MKIQRDPAVRFVRCLKKQCAVSGIAESAGVVHWRPLIAGGERMAACSLQDED